MNKQELQEEYQRLRGTWESGDLDHNEYALRLDDLLAAYLRLRKSRMPEEGGSGRPHGVHPAQVTLAKEDVMIRQLLGSIALGFTAGFVTWWELSKLRYRGKVYVYGAWHDEMCLVSRYPCRQSDPDGFPWCTCPWRRTTSRSYHQV